jgi:hypothetical protein
MSNGTSDWCENCRAVKIITNAFARSLKMRNTFLNMALTDLVVEP